jgi:hypothetical protein
MKKFLIILAAVLMCCSFSTEATAQRSKTKGFNYKSHAQKNKKAGKIATAKWNAGGKKATGFKCSKSSKRSKARRRR